jgi:outer membrane protein TolC
MSYELNGSYAHSDGLRNGFDFDSYKLVGGIAVRQPLLKNFWTDQGRTGIRINKKTIKISELGVSFVMMDTINQVQQAYYELLFAVENLGVQLNLLTSLQETLDGIRRQVEVGTLTVLEEKLARSSLSRVQADLVVASNTVALAENALRTLIGQSATEWKAPRLQPSERLLLVPENLDLYGSWEAGFNLRPDLAQLVQDVERFGIDLKFRHNQLFPSLDVVASYGRRGADAIQTLPPAPADASFSTAWEQIEDSDAPSHSVGLVLSTPLGRTRERASYKAAKQLKDQAQLRLKQKEELVIREISDALHNARSAFDRAIASRRAKDEAREALEAEQQKLSVGTSTLFFVLELQSDLADTQSAEVRARADYNKALSQLHFAEGTLLERHKLTIELR